MKKAATYRMSQETEDIINMISIMFKCSKTEAVESCIKIAWDSNMLINLKEKCVRRYKEEYNITMEYEPNMNMIVREANKSLIRVI